MTDLDTNDGRGQGSVASGGAWLDRYAGAMIGVYGTPQRVLVRGEGCYVWDSDGRRYLDLLGGIAVNALWPRTVIGTAALQVAMEGHGAAERRRVPRPEIVADAAYVILTKDSREFTGKFCIDDEILRAAGETDFTQYRDPGVREDELLPDFFL